MFLLRKGVLTYDRMYVYVHRHGLAGGLFLLLRCRERAKLRATGACSRPRIDRCRSPDSLGKFEGEGTYVAVSMNAVFLGVHIGSQNCWKLPCEPWLFFGFGECYYYVVFETWYECLQINKHSGWMCSLGGVTGAWVGQIHA